MKKILILTVVMGIGMMFLSESAKAQVANNSNVNTPITATVGVNIPTIQTQNGMIAVEGSGGAIFIVGGTPVAPPPPPISGLVSITMGTMNVPTPPMPPVPGGVIIPSNNGAFLPGGGGVLTFPSGVRAMFIGDYPIVR